MVSDAVALQQLKEDALPKTLFKIANNGVLPVWILMAIAPDWQYTFNVVLAMVSFMAMINVFGIVELFRKTKAKNDEKDAFREDKVHFYSLRGAVTLFRTAPIRLVLAGWMHFLVFDMLVGHGMAVDAVEQGIPRILVAPCLFITMWIGPSGVVLYCILRTIYPLIFQ